MGDYSRRLDRFTNVSGSTVLAAADDLSSSARVLVAAVTGWTIYVQRIQVNIVTDNAATLTFEDNGAPVVIAKTKVSPGIVAITFDFGPEGRALTVSKQFELKNSAAGLAADITWVAYMRATATQAA